MSGELLNTEWHIDEADNTLTINRVQDVEDILDVNKYLQTVSQKADWGRHVARIPNIFIEQWLKEEWDRGNNSIRMFTPEFDAMVERKLQDPEWKFLRVDSKQSQHILGWDGATA